MTTPTTRAVHAAIGLAPIRERRQAAYDAMRAAAVDAAA